MSNWPDSTQPTGGKLSPDPILTQLVFEATWDLLTRWQKGNPITADAYRDDFGEELFSRPEVGQRLFLAEFIARLELSSGPSATALSESAVPLLEWFGRPPVLPPPPYPYLAAPMSSGDLGSFGKFRIHREIGRGGLGVVFKASNTRAMDPDRPHALKVLLPGGDSSKNMQRLVNDARVLSEIQHEHVVRIYNAEKEPVAGVGEVGYLEMEYIYGPTLETLVSHFLQVGCPVPVELAVELIRQTADGLAHIHNHEKKFIHRDIKPGNILLEWKVNAAENIDPWHVRLCDFGLALALDQPRITSEKTIVGTKVYMSPEQLEPHPNRPVSPKSDIFALGMILYELVVGEHPFLAASDRKTTNKIVGVEYTFPRQLNPSIPVEIEGLIRSMLLQKPGDRPEAEKVRKVLADFQGVDKSPLPATFKQGTPAKAVVRLSSGTDFPSEPLKVYIASTTSELLPFRKAVIDAIRQKHPTRYIVYPPQDYPEEFAFPIDDCLRMLEECHVYVGLFGFRYGMVVKGYLKSILEEEYREAVRTNKERLIYVASKKALNNTIDWTDDLDLSEPLIHALRKELESNKQHQEFTKCGELADDVLHALSQFSLQQTTSPPNEVVPIPDDDRLSTAFKKYRLQAFSEFVRYNEKNPSAKENDPSLPKLPFMESQQLYVLRAGIDAKIALHPERFREARFAQKTDSKNPTEPDQLYWEKIERPELLKPLIDGTKGCRVVFTTDAGLGKTENLKWLAHECSQQGKNFVFLLSAGEKIALHELIPECLATEVLDANNDSRVSKSRIIDTLEAARSEGTLTLVIDGLDQSTTESMDWLKKLLDPHYGWSQCNMVLAGRPFSLEAHWDDLFEGRKYQYVQIAEMNQTQQEKLIGKARYQAIPIEAHSILSTPRVLEFVRKLALDKLSVLRTVSDVYWQAVQYMLREALLAQRNPHDKKTPVSELELEDLTALLGALAFTMYSYTIRDPKTNELRPNLDRVSAAMMSTYLRETATKLQAVIPSYQEQKFETNRAILVRLNAFLRRGWLDCSTIGNDTDLLWRNASLQEFLAAYWVCRWDSRDAALLQDWVFDEHRVKNRGFYWLWRYATEMPDEVIWPDRSQRKLPKSPTEAWVQAMTPLYVAPLDKDGLPIRSTEFLYRSWDRPGNPMAHSEKGKESRQKFLSEFQTILRDTGSDRQKVALELVGEGAFIPLVESGKPNDTGTFRMGSAADDESASSDERPQHPVQLSAYLLHRYCVTNSEYELFDPWHKKVRWYGEGQHPDVAVDGIGADDRCPVVNVTWYDAWCFAQWLGEIPSNDERQRHRICLPSEAQWEYACRAGRETPFTFGVDHPGESVTPDICNFNGKYPFPEGTSTAHIPKEILYRGKTIAVSELVANIWGFYQMHGNVWEWCTDWYLPSFYSIKEGIIKDPENTQTASARVLRGGGWYFLGGVCRSADRNRREPSYRYQNIGFRLAAKVPDVGAKSSEE